MKLNEIRDNPGAHHRKKRVGRGIGSGIGKTSGRGVKGQGSRTGVRLKGFEGGQMPLHMRLPKRGFKNIFAKKYQILNLDRLEKAIGDQKLSLSAPITVEALIAAGLIRDNGVPLRLLARGELKSKVSLTVAKASQAAIDAVKAQGGEVTVTEA
ncbi:MAG: 50S ribosomal protein L15 [Alphaproteobacteria bacterium]|nr:50S ribosomal protein L15 [Alphaproteobacteria bacterium]